MEHVPCLLPFIQIADLDLNWQLNERPYSLERDRPSQSRSFLRTPLVVIYDSRHQLRSTGARDALPPKSLISSGPLEYIIQVLNTCGARYLLGDNISRVGWCFSTLIKVSSPNRCHLRLVTLFQGRNYFYHYMSFFFFF